MNDFDKLVGEQLETMDELLKLQAHMEMRKDFFYSHFFLYKMLSEDPCFLIGLRISYSV